MEKELRWLSAEVCSGDTNTSEVTKEVVQTIENCVCVLMQDTSSLKHSVKSGRAAGKAIHQNKAQAGNSHNTLFFF